MFTTRFHRPARALPLALALALAFNFGCQRLAPPALVNDGGGSSKLVPSVEWSPDGNAVEIRNLLPVVVERLRALPSDSSVWPKVFSVSVDGSGIPMLGSWAIEPNKAATPVLRFTPRFPLMSGVVYRAVFDSARLDQISTSKCDSTFALPKKPMRPAAEVRYVYPSSDRLPENLLRIYLHFSGPMRHGDTYEHIRLLDVAGKPVATPFVTFGEELWDESDKRLTLFLDPGRVKSGLKPREEAGPVLEAGKKYTLVVDTGWRDAHGQSLAKEFRKEFTAVAPITTGIEISQWTIEPPVAGSTAPLIIRFPRTLDHALLQRVLQIADSSGKLVDGAIAVESNETAWRYTPREKWRAGRYEVIVDSILEDVAGNRVGRAFEVDESRAPAEQNPAPTRLPFEVR